MKTRLGKWTVEGNFNVIRKGDEIGFEVSGEKAGVTITLTSWLPRAQAVDLGAWLIEQTEPDDAKGGK